MTDAVEWFAGSVGESDISWASANRASGPTREWNRHGSPTYQRSDPRNENAMDTETAGINKGNGRDYDNGETLVHRVKG